MSRIPYLDRLGEALESAATRHNGAGRGSRPARLVVGTALTVSLIAGTMWLAWQPSADEGATTATTPPSTDSDLPAASLPQDWGLLPPDMSAIDLDGVLLNAVAFGSGQFVALGSIQSDSPSGTTEAIVIASDDGLTWRELGRFRDVFLADIAFNDGRVAIAGSRVDGAGDRLTATAVLVLWDGSEWTDQPLAPVPDASFALAQAITPWDGGFVVGGTALRAQSERPEGEWRPVIWWSRDGSAWHVVSGEPFEWSLEAGISDVLTFDGSLVAFATVSLEPGSSRPAVWVASDPAIWEGASPVEIPSRFGFHAARAATEFEDQLVATGFADDFGRGAAVWVSPDGDHWDYLDPDEVEPVPNAVTQIHAVAASEDGVVAVGAAYDGSHSRYVIWTSPDGRTWQRHDLTDHGLPWPVTSALGVAAGIDRWVVVGSRSGLAGQAEAAIWLGPPPEGVPVSVALEPAGSAQPPSLSVEPTKATTGTRLHVYGLLRGGFEGPTVSVWLVSNGQRYRLCEARTAGSRLECRVTLGELDSAPPPGTYSFAVGAHGESLGDATLEVLPDGADLVIVSGTYLRHMSPGVQRIVVRNHGATTIDLSGWRLRDSGASEPEFVFPDGTLLEPGTGATVDFSGPRGAACWENRRTYFHWCKVAGDGRIIAFDPTDLLWRGGDIHLLDGSGALRGEWAVTE